jgi:hypothetical protein
MADNKPTANFYDNLGGINLKASEYAVGRAQFLDIRNMDFDVPNALNKRPGSTLATTGQAASGPINSLFEFVKLTGESYIVYGSNTAMFYLNVNTPTVLDTGWTNGQPTDMLTFVNRLWLANGQKFDWWTGLTLSPTGLNTPSTQLQANYQNASSGATWVLIGGATHIINGVLTFPSFTCRGVYVAYSYLRTDGYVGPADFLRDARNVAYTTFGAIATSGAEYFNSYTLLAGFTVPTGQGITSISIWVATDTVTDLSTKDLSVGNVQAGALGYYDASTGAAHSAMSITLKPSADLSRFQLYTTIPISSLTARSVYEPFTASANITMFCSAFSINHASFSIVAPAQLGFSGMVGNFFGTYTPKYIEVNQNIMFMAGFSSAPSVVWFSELGDPENVLPENFFEVRTNDGDRVYAMKAYNNYVLIMKETSFHKLIGNSADNFQLVQLSDQYGCISDKTVVEYSQKLVWLDRKGVMRFDGASWEIISTPVEDVFRRMNVANAKENACAVHWPDRNQIWFGIPLDNSTKNNITVVWDYLVDAWTFFDGFNPAAFAPVKGYNARSTTWRGDYSGMIYYHGDVFYGDNGQGITCIARPHWDKWQGEHSTSLWRRLFLDVNTASGITGAITGKVFSNYDSSTVQATFTMYQNQFQSRAEMGVNGKAVTAEFAHFSASLPLLINGYSWAKRTLRNV